MNIAFPYQVDGRGLTATADDTTHIRHLIEQLLFTAPGERVNRPGMGSGLLNLVFGPNGSEVASATEYLVQGALQQWLSELILVESVRAISQDSKLVVTVQYVIKRTQEREVTRFQREV